MSLTPDEAAQSLRDAQSAEQRSREAYGYSLSAPYLFMWGTIWMAGYAGMAFLASGISGLLWIILIISGVVGSTVLGQRQHAKNKTGRTAAINRRMGGTIGIIYAFTAALYFLLQPVMNIHDAASFWMWNKVVAAYWPLLFAALYSAFGLWMGVRYAILGIFLAVATLAGYFLIGGYLFYVWLAATGGGSLFLTGFWMRKA